MQRENDGVAATAVQYTISLVYSLFCLCRRENVYHFFFVPHHQIYFNINDIISLDSYRCTVNLRMCLCLFRFSLFYPPIDLLYIYDFHKVPLIIGDGSAPTFINLCAV